MIGALTLILLGALLLLANFDLVSWSVFAELWRFWPLILVLWGLQLIFGRSRSGRFAVGVVAMIGVVYLALSLIVAASPRFQNWLGEDAVNLFPMAGWQAESENFERTSQSIAASSDTSVSSRSVRFSIGAAEFTLNDSSSTTQSLVVDAPASLPLDIDTEVAAGVFKITAETPSRPWMFFRHQDWNYLATLHQPTLPTQLSLKLGAGKANLDLTAIRLTQLDLELGAGTVTANLAGSAVPGEASIEVGAGTASLNLPMGYDVEISYDTGAGTVRVDGQTLRGSGTYVSRGSLAVPTTDTGAANTSSTTVQLDLTVGAGIITLTR